MISAESLRDDRKPITALCLILPKELPDKRHLVRPCLPISESAHGDIERGSRLVHIFIHNDADRLQGCKDPSLIADGYADVFPYAIGGDH